MMTAIGRIEEETVVLLWEIREVDVGVDALTSESITVER
jgi:hypothetical protein